MTARGYTVFVFNQVTQAKISLAMCLLAYTLFKMNIGDGYCHRYMEEHGNLCVTVDPVSKDCSWHTDVVGLRRWLLVESVIHRLGLYASLIGFNPRRLSRSRRG